MLRLGEESLIADLKIEGLEMPTVQECLDQKPKRIISVSSTDSVFKALELMKSNRVRAILVIDEERLVGIVSQGDCAIRAYLRGLNINSTPVSDIMTKEPLTVKPSDSMDHCMAIISSRGIRHIPAVDRNKVIGIVSVGDVVKETMSQLSQNASFLETFIKGHSG